MNIIKHDGQIITMPGIYSGIDIEDYHHNAFLCDAQSISSTGIRQALKRPSLYWCHSPYNKHRAKMRETSSLNFGKLTHHLLLGEKYFQDRYAVRPDTYPDDETKKWNLNAKVCREWYDKQIKSGRTVITGDDLEKIVRMANVMKEHPVIDGGILSGPVEHSILFKHKGWWLRSRPDVMPRDAHYTDLKTTQEIAYEDLERTIHNYGYHIQGALVRMACRAIGIPFESFFFVFTEVGEPHDCRVFKLFDEHLDLGEEEIEVTIDLLNQCIERWDFPGQEGFSRTITTIGLPPWAATRRRNDLQLIRQELGA